ncbi:hypothetical protein FO519_002627 [Halicephalobus sp. NKZ332]|nr:hypothetical protein FO519_002627 [Halicephalobus sp. NKZ332]
MTPIKAVIFDMGGVFLKYPDPGFLDRIIKFAETNKALGKILEDFEIGNNWMGDIGVAIKEISDEEIRNKVIEGLQVIGSLTSQSVLDQNFVTAVKILREKGFKTALLTNNGWRNPEKTESLVLEDLSDFDVVVESCKVKMRKPNPEIYLYTVDLLKLKPEECVFIDDFEVNIEGAKKIGMPGIQVVLGDSETAIKDLEKITGVTLKA